MVVISGSHTLHLVFFYYCSMYCKSNLIQGANKVVVVVAIENVHVLLYSCNFHLLNEKCQRPVEFISMIKKFRNVKPARKINKT